MTTSQIDKLGDRLRDGTASDADFQLLENYRLSFLEAHKTVTRMIGERLRLDPIAARSKSTTSIVEKLRRGRTRLRRMQDITGCRFSVVDMQAQDRVVGELMELLPNAAVIDRRAKPSHGYRAVHIVVAVNDRWVEIQVRTIPQHEWALLSEQFADVAGQQIKYGAGREDVRRELLECSRAVQIYEMSSPSETTKAMLNQAFDRAKRMLRQLARV